MLLLDGMDLLKSGQFLDNAKLPSEPMMDQSMLLILTKMVNISLLEEKMVKLNFGNILILKLLLKNGTSIKLLMMLKSLQLNIGLLLLLILRSFLLITMLRTILKLSLPQVKISLNKNLLMEKRPNKLDTRLKILPGILNPFIYSLDVIMVN